MKVILTLHAVSTLILVGVIWYVHLVHYPLLDHLKRNSFTSYHADHIRRTTRVIAPLMLIEACTAFLVLIIPSKLISPFYAWMGMALLILIWVSTFFQQVPQHRVLSAGFDSKSVQALKRTNLIRTLAWTGRGALVATIV
jgi:hypothetical protein